MFYLALARKILEPFNDLFSNAALFIMRKHRGVSLAREGRDGKG